jgi:hypothetical protein
MAFLTQSFMNGGSRDEREPATSGAFSRWRGALSTGTHSPEQRALRSELQDRFAPLDATSDESLGEQERAHLKIAMDAFLWLLDH